VEIFSFLENIHTLQIIIFVIGFAFLTFEMFHPGFGVPGVIGLLLLVTGILITARNVFEALVMLIILLAIVGLALMMVLHSASKGRLSKTLILKDSLNKEEGFVGTDDMKYFIGKEGVSITVLHPAGTAEFDGVKLDVVTEGNYLDKNTRVKVSEVTGRRIVVKEIL
jgi:membrane-bound ClpP family serine protease